MTLERRLGDLGYRVTSLVDRGGASTVYRAVDVDHGDEDVAIKVLPPGSDPERLRREVLILASLDHPGVVPYLDAGGFDDGTLYLVSPWIAGRTLHRLLADDGPPPTERAIALAIRLARVLDDVHVSGVVHRDLTPRNIMVSDADEVTLIDFGLSRSETEATITAGADLAGTPRYLAPEVIEGAQPDHRADQYAAAVVLYELFSGRWPFPDGGTVATALHHQLHSAPTPLLEVDPDADPAVDATLARALAKRPDDRFTSMADFAAALVQPVPVHSSPPPAVAALDRSEADPFDPTPPAEWSRSAGGPAPGGRGRVLRLVAALVVVAGVAAWFAVGPGFDPLTGSPTDDATAEREASADAAADPVIAADDTSTSLSAAGSDEGVDTPIEVVDGTADGLACNLLLQPDFESGVLPVNYYRLEENPEREVILDGVGVDGSAALRVGEANGYGLYAEAVQVVPDRSYVFSVTVEKSGQVEEATVEVAWLDEEFNAIEIPGEIVAVPAEGRHRLAVFTPPVPDGVRYALPVLYKDASPGILLADELVFGPAEGPCAATSGN